MNENCLYKTRDRLYNLVDSAPNLECLYKGVETILTVLEYTEGLWQVASYCYKANEVCERAIAALQQYKQVENFKKVEKINQYILQLRKMGDRYHQLQHTK